jgi:hypothetical protein
VGIRRVVERVVDDDAHVALVGTANQLAELFDRSEFGQDGAEVGDVVAAITQRRRVDRWQPQGIDAEPLEVVEPGDEPTQVARAVAVAVDEAAHHDLVEDRAAIPLGVECESRKLDGRSESHAG